MVGAKSSGKGFLADLPTPILPKTENRQEKDLSRCIDASVASKFGGVQHIHLALTMTDEDYMEHTVFAFVKPHNPDNFS